MKEKAHTDEWMMNESVSQSVSGWINEPINEWMNE